ncbi:MAG: glycosyltransferase family 2 protein, partial [Lentisphaeria bacterium]|nr:glycosyltransferase family 2 protein [Lentisphaeria bacterium]
MNYKCKTPILLIFFNRPSTFEKVFEKVKKVQPETLILAQDGPRNSDDNANIKKCREIAEKIDWPCSVIKDYSEVNLGCGVRPQSAISSALEKFEQVIILEDDCIPSDSFFPYCEELLERYKDDERIAYISGLNHFESWDCGESDYFFTKAGAIWGWATWRRAWKSYYDYYAHSIADAYIVKLYAQQINNKHIFDLRMSALQRANASQKNNEKLSYWDTQWGFANYTQNMLVIVPRVNLIHNIGVGTTS